MYDSQSDNSAYYENQSTGKVSRLSGNNKCKPLDKSIVYNREITDGFKMEISQDFKKVLFANKNENYILETVIDKQDKVSTNVVLLHQLDGKIVRYICHDGGKDFLLVACDEFDK